jgi:hypothetical protein
MSQSAWSKSGLAKKPVTQLKAKPKDSWGETLEVNIFNMADFGVPLRESTALRLTM